MAGLLSGKAWQVVFNPRALHIYESMEDSLPIYWQHHQEEGNVQNSTLLVTHVYAFLPQLVRNHG